MSIDAFGFEVPAVPGYDKVIDSAGSHLPQTKTLRLGSSLTATHDAASDATVLDAVSAPPADGSVTLAKLANLAAHSLIGNTTGSSATPTAVPLTAAGAAMAAAADAAAQTALLNAATQALKGLLSATDKTLIDKGEQFIGSGTLTDAAIGDHSLATWTAGKYTGLRLKIRQTAHATTGGINDVKLDGLTGTYKSTTMYGAPTDFGDAHASLTAQASWYVAFPNAIGTAWLEFDIPAIGAGKRSYSGRSEISSTTDNMTQVHGGSNTDVTHDVTGVTAHVINDTCTFYWELYGTLA